ncbi:MAG: chemotaxis protein CheC [Candidatus Goldiibacteriota bacterium]
MEGRLTEFQSDALKELGNVGAGNAATALSQLLGRNITLSIPKVDVLPVEELVARVPGKGKIVAAVYLKIFGEIPARALIIFPQDKVFLLLDLLFKQEPGTTKKFTENEQSAVKEIGNIIVSSYLNALSKFIGLNAVPSVPALAVDMVEAIFQTVSAEMAETGRQALLVETEMTEEITKVNSSLFLIPDEGSMEKILEALDNTVNGA